MSNIRIQRLSNILNRYSFTSGKISFLENNCKLNEFSKQDFDEALRFAELEPQEQRQPARFFTRSYLLLTGTGSCRLLSSCTAI
ncbi:MAG: hypothetical protein K2P45_02405 [Eubacterium sp.]|nr:hypothetical protein [Eubacterium sp.]